MTVRAKRASRSVSVATRNCPARLWSAAAGLDGAAPAPAPPPPARPARRAGRRRASADEREAWHSIANGPPRRAARPRPPGLPPVLVRAARLPHRHLDAERRAIVARARADELPVSPRPDRLAAVRPHPALLVPVRGDQRSGAQA